MGSVGGKLGGARTGGENVLALAVSRSSGRAGGTGKGVATGGTSRGAGLLVVQAGPGWSGELWRKTYGWWMGRLPGDHLVPYVEEESGSWGCRS